MGGHGGERAGEVGVGEYEGESSSQSPLAKDSAADTPVSARG